MRRFRPAGVTQKEKLSAVVEDQHGIFMLYEDHMDQRIRQIENNRALSEEVARLQSLLAAALHPNRPPVAWGIFSRGQYVAVRETEAVALGEATHLHALNGTSYEVRPLWGKGAEHG